MHIIYSITYFETGLGIFPAIFLEFVPAAAEVVPPVSPPLLGSFTLATDTLEQMLEACECSEDIELFRDCGSRL